MRNKIELEAIRYKSEPDAIADLLLGRVQVMNGTATSVATHVKAGKLKALATMLDVRSPLMPDLPTLCAGQRRAGGRAQQSGRVLCPAADRDGQMAGP